MCDGMVHYCARRHILVLANSISWVNWEQSCLVSFLGDNVSYWWIVIFLQTNTSSAYGRKLLVEDNQELTL